MSLPPRILVSNDDGYQSEGIRALAEAMQPLGEVWVVAPEQEQSATAHSISIHRPLRLREVRERWYAVDGTPTDCSYLAVNHLLKDRRPSLMVSGINHGANMADDVTYSGTVAGALEAALLGIPGLAVSLARTREDYDFSYAARAAAAVAMAMLEKPLPPFTFLNVNVPRGTPKGFRTTVQARRNHVTEVLVRDDPKGRPYFWIDEGQNEWEPHDRSDYQAVRDGYVSITPLQPDLTAHDALAAVEKISFETEVALR